MILRNTFIRLIPTLALVGGTLHACTSPDDGTTAPGAGVRKLRPQLEAFADGAQTAPGEESVDRLDAYLFAAHRRPHVLVGDGWPEQRDWLRQEWIELEAVGLWLDIVRWLK